MFVNFSGSAIMQDGSTIRNGYPLDLDNVSQGCRIGMMRCSDGTLHYYYNGADQGVACGNIPPGKKRIVLTMLANGYRYRGKQPCHFHFYFLNWDQFLNEILTSPGRLDFPRKTCRQD